MERGSTVPTPMPHSAQGREVQPHSNMLARLLAVWLFASWVPAAAQTTVADRLVRLNEGIQLFDRGDYAQAETVFADLVAETPDEPAPQYYLALTRMQLAVNASDAAQRAHRFAQAGQSLTAALAAEPELVDAYLDLGIARLGQPGREAAAAEALERDLADPDG